MIHLKSTFQLKDEIDARSVQTVANLFHIVSMAHTGKYWLSPSKIKELNKRCYKSPCYYE